MNSSQLPAVDATHPTLPTASARRRRFLSLATAVFVLAACDKPAPFRIKDTSPKSDREAKWDPPQSYPEWAYDKPRMMHPNQELQPEPRARTEDPLHYFTNKTLVPIRQPGNYKPEEIPRICVWVTDNNGFEWKKAGYFGQFEADFWFVASKDGDYGIRFTGPGQEPAKIPITPPERVYHVDTVLPVVEVRVEPNQPQYVPGQKVVVNWKASDYHLIEQPCEIGYTIDFSGENTRWEPLQKDLAAEGSFNFTIPAAATDHGLIFRVAAMDRADNLGLGFSHIMQIVGTGDRPDAPARMQSTAANTAPSIGGARTTSTATTIGGAPTAATSSRTTNTTRTTAAPMGAYQTDPHPTANTTFASPTTGTTNSTTPIASTPSSATGSDELILVDSPTPTISSTAAGSAHSAGAPIGTASSSAIQTSTDFGSTNRSSSRTTPGSISSNGLSTIQFTTNGTTTGSTIGSTTGTIGIGSTGSTGSTNTIGTSGTIGTSSIGASSIGTTGGTNTIGTTDNAGTTVRSTGTTPGGNFANDHLIIDMDAQQPVASPMPANTTPSTTTSASGATNSTIGGSTNTADHSTSNSTISGASGGSSSTGPSTTTFNRSTSSGSVDTTGTARSIDAPTPGDSNETPTTAGSSAAPNARRDEPPGGAMIDFDVLFENIPAAAPNSTTSPRPTGGSETNKTTAGATEWTIPIGSLLMPSLGRTIAPKTAESKKKTRTPAAPKTEDATRTDEATRSERPKDAKSDEQIGARPADAREPRVDAAGGRRLVAPLPGTLGTGAQTRSAPRTWMKLDRATRDGQSVWVLPRPAFMDDAHGLFELKYMADNPEAIPAGPGADTRRPYANLDQFSEKESPMTPRADEPTPN